QADLVAAGIPYAIDGPNGPLFADFHSLRHTFITNLANGGVHPKTAQTLARHSTITLTMDRYSHTLVGEQVEALNLLPDLSQANREAVRATGTIDAAPSEKNLASLGAPSAENRGKKLGENRRKTHENKGVAAAAPSDPRLARNLAENLALSER